jgi:hypothetical protein
MSRRCYRLVSLFFGFPLLVSLLPADEVPVSWIGVASNWSPAVVPNNGGGNTYDVSIGQGAFVVVDTSPTINSLTATEFFPGPAFGISVDPGATLNAGSVGLNGIGSLIVNGTANVGTLGLSLCGGCPSFDVSSGGLLNVGTFSGGGNLSTVEGTLNFANPNLNIGSDNGGLDIDGGAVTVGTGNLLPLNSPNTFVNAGTVVYTGVGGIAVGAGGSFPGDALQVLPSGTSTR